MRSVHRALLPARSAARLPRALPAHPAAQLLDAHRGHAAADVLEPAEAAAGAGHGGHAVTQPVPDAAAPESVTHAVYLEPVTVPGVVQAQPVALGDVAGAGIEPAGLLFAASDVWPGRNAVESPA